MQILMTGNIVFIGFCHLLKSFGTYAEFKCFMERFFLLTMFISLYETAPWSVVSTIDGSTLPQDCVEELLCGTLVKHTIEQKKRIKAECDMGDNCPDVFKDRLRG